MTFFLTGSAIIMVNILQHSSLFMAKIEMYTPICIIFNLECVVKKAAG